MEFEIKHPGTGIPSLFLQFNVVDDNDVLVAVSWNKQDLTVEGDGFIKEVQMLPPGCGANGGQVLVVNQNGRVRIKSPKF